MCDDEFTQLNAQLINDQRERLGLLPFPLQLSDVKKKLRKSKPRLKELNQRKAELVRELSCYSHNDYRLQPRGSGAPRSSVVERELERRGRKEEELRHIQREIDGTRRVLDCLQILPPDSRRIIERVYLKQESPLRVALDLEVGERTIKVWLHRSMLVVWLALATDWKPAG